MVDGTFSSWKSVTSGVPEGCILGPFLFVVYISDLPDSERSKIYMFPDDTKVPMKVSNEGERSTLQKDLDHLEEWAASWQVKFKAATCKVMHMGKENMNTKILKYYKDIPTL